MKNLKDIRIWQPLGAIVLGILLFKSPALAGVVIGMGAFFWLLNNLDKRGKEPHE